MIVNVSTITISGILAGGFEGTYPQTLYTVSAASMTDIYAAYYSLSGDRSCVSGPNPQTFLENGSFVVDHFSTTGAKVTTDFLEQYVMVNGVQALMQQIGGYCKCL